MRITGMASGFDTESMVQQLMNVERMKVNRYEQQKQVNLWRRDSYTKINKAMANFVVNTKKNFGLGGRNDSFNSINKLDYVMKAVSSNETIATVKGTGKSAQGEFVLNVDKMAKNDTLTSDKLEDGKIKEEFKIDGIKIADAGTSAEDLIKKLNEIKSGKESGLGKEDAKKVKDMMDKTEMSFFYDKGTQKIFIQGTHAKNEGSNNTIVKSIEGLGDKYTDGQDAVVSVNGEVLNTEGKGNNIVFNSIEIELKATGNTKIGVKTDTDAIIEKVENFVKEYNDLLDLLNLSVNEKKYNSYHPLSKEEKEAMKDKDIELWEEKAKSGMLNRDETLNRILDGTRRHLYSSVSGLDEKFRISSLGITTGEYQKGSAGGKLEIDTDKLRKALEDNPEDAMRLLFENDGTSGKARKPENQGVFTRIYDSLMDGMKEIVNKSGPGEDAALLQGIDRAITTDYNLKGKTSEIDKLVREMDQKIDDMNILLARKEDSYYAKFTAMEKYVYKMNSQSAWIGQQMM